jgi:hypothetical protein
MLDLQVTLDGTKIVIEGLNKWAQVFPIAIQNALTRSAQGIYRYAFQYLSGPGAKGISREVTSKKTGKKYLKWQKQAVPAGGYPVPVRTGWLRQMLNWLKPGESKMMASFSELGSHTMHSGGTITAGPNEVIVFDAAQYARTIFEGLRSSAKFGKRNALIDGFNIFNQGGKIREILLEEIMRAKT